MKTLKKIAIGSLAALCLISSVFSAQGELGTGVPDFAIYSAAVGNNTVVWSMTDATIPFAAGCAQLRLHPETMGADAYKAAIAIMMTAKVTKTRVRFYSHAPRDGGCGVDYIQLM